MPWAENADPWAAGADPWAAGRSWSNREWDSWGSPDVAPPPGFEDENCGELQGAEVAELHSLMGGGARMAAAATKAAASQPAPKSRAGSRGVSHTTYTREEGLLFEQQVEVKPWEGSEPGAGPALDEAGILDKDASFDNLGLSEELLRGVYEMGFVKPSKIQAAALSFIRCRDNGKLGENMIAQAQNGSGKTATFALALLTAMPKEVDKPQALVVCPTRELARQNEEVIKQLGKYLPVSTSLVVPSQDKLAVNPQCHVLVGTPGKTMDLAKRRKLDLSGIRVFVLDEADTMLDQENSMGPQVTYVRESLPRHVQVLFFSATYPDELRVFAEKLVPRAFSIKVKKTELTVSTITQMYFQCWNFNDKMEKLNQLYGAMSVGQSVVFVNARQKAFKLATWMRDAGYAVSLICGTQTEGAERMDPALRDQVMDEFRSGVTRVLIATDVLSRGIDVPQVTLVVNFDLPVRWPDYSTDMETYLHRIGRTGRFGLRGIAVNLVTEKERPMIDEICSFFSCSIAELDPDFEALEERLRVLR